MNKGEILIYENQEGNIKIDVRLEEDTIWLTIEQMSLLFGKAKSTINEHILNIYLEKELYEVSSIRKIGISDFSTKPTNFYNLDVIISVGYRVKSLQGTQFRIWATQRLKEFIVKGFILNDDRFKSGNSMNYFNELQNRIRDIRLSERFFYQKIKDIYTTSIDYDSESENTILLFKIVQNKLLWAISQNTAAELVFKRVDANLPLLGMQSFDKTDKTKILKSDISVAKNYLNESEIKLLGLLVEQYLAFAETMAMQQTPMYMKDWAARFDSVLQLNGREILNHTGNISHENAISKSNLEFSKYKTLQSNIEKELNFKELENDIKKLEKH